MKVIILAGGLGTRIKEFTKTIPKPMIKVLNKPLIVHIMSHYLKYGFNDFIVAAGYKKDVIKKYFNASKKKNSDYTHVINKKKCNIKVVDTGNNTMTGGRLKRLKKFLVNNKDFMFTYGDGISNVNLNKLVKSHKKNKKIVSVTAVRPPARFGEIVIKKNLVISFKEKPQVQKGWINGGFFIANSNFLNFIRGDKEILEKKPLETVSKKRQLNAFQHKGFWKCMDTIRDKEVLTKILKKKNFFYD